VGFLFHGAIFMDFIVRSSSTRWGLPMLHCSKPSDFGLPSEVLAKNADCPECGTSVPFGAGRLHIGHYFDPKQQLCAGIVWTCSDLCYLSFENPQFMGRA
jgi:hypothetical protein